MDGNPTSARIEALLAHREWVRRMALVLTADENAAGDLEQDLWVEVLDDPPQPRTSIRGWLATALRRDMLDRRRSEARRLRREVAAARPEATPSAGDLVAEADAQRRVVQAVVELEEPYRTTVLLRWFEDLKPAAIAKRQGIPVDTVRTRLRRAIERLRGKLMRDAGGDRTAYLAALLPLARRAGGAEAAGGSVAAAALGGILMGTGTKVAVAAGAIAVAGLFAWWLVPGAGDGQWTGRSTAVPGRLAGTAGNVSTSVRSETAVLGEFVPPPSVAAAPDSEFAGGPAGQPGTAAPWISLLASQRAVVKRLEAAVLPLQEWSGDATLETRLRVLEKEFGVPISWDASLPHDFAAAPVPAMFDGASLWEALAYVTAYKGAPLRITRDGVRFVPSESVRGPAILERYEEDPYAAFALARDLIEEDRRFHPGGSGIEDCESTPVRLGAVAPNATILDLAADRVAYEGFRGLLGRTPCPLPEGKAPLRDVAASLQRDTDARVLLDPAVAEVEVEVGPSLSYLEVLDDLMAQEHPFRGRGVGWTWVSGWMVITTTRDREARPPSPPPGENQGK